ncbi:MULTISPECIES: ABC transporter substrate-binding protein [unclassified Iodidimonas]|jgi:iron complex transport system substrate-binding protein|uniref:ABC transporter substrate-binding protein n=2 Tax=Iodidimonas TaxID=2066486 RepID=UPI002482A440|nr:MULTISPECIES: ABC transporter substrate-binding protein [unclassified Iodidimonas]
MMDEARSYFDARGQVFAPHEGAARIVSLSSGLTDLLFALDLGEKLVGCTGDCAKSMDGLVAISKVGEIDDLDLRKIADLNPTHILVHLSATPQPVIDALAAADLPLLAVDVQMVQDNLDLYTLLGGVFQVPTAADSLARRFEAAQARVKMAMRAKSLRRVLYLDQDNPYKTVAKQSYAGSLMALARFELVGAPDQLQSADDAVIIEPESLILGVDRVLFNGSPARFKRAQIKAFAERYEVPRAKLIRLDHDLADQFGARAIDVMDQLIALREKADRAD